MFGIYIHWPYCAFKCPYCDFNSHVTDTIDHKAWAKAYEMEISFYANLTGKQEVTSIFFGGGTPSLMHPQTVAHVISEIQKNWPVAHDCEITLEANPNSVEVQKFQDFRLAGVNRVSLGVQALNDTDLKFLGRKHSIKEALQALEIAQNVFDRYSFDLIYARPDQKVSDWEEELQNALRYANGHLSLYQLTIEPQTPFFTQHARGDFSVPEQDVAGDFYELTQNILGAHNMPAYEVSNHANTGQESVHNMTYWKYEDYVGIGPGAHGRLTLNGQKYATRGHRAPDIWMKHVDQKGHGAHPFEEISQQTAFQECFMMGMRIKDGIAWHKLEHEACKAQEPLFDGQKLEALVQENLIGFDDKKIWPTLDGMQRLNSILGYLL